jgi:HEAT repeat protein
MAKREEGTAVLARHARLVIYAGSKSVDLAKLVVPPGVTVLGIEDRIRRLVEGMKSADDTVAGQAAYLLGEHGAALDAVDPLVEALKHKSDYVRACAAGALGSVGKRAAPALPALKGIEASAHENYRKGYRDAIEAIEAAGESAEAEKARQELRERQARVRKLIDALAAKAKKASAPRAAEKDAKK